MNIFQVLDRYENGERFFTNVYSPGAGLQGIILDYIEMPEAILNGSDFREVSFKYAKLSALDAQDADFTNADFTDCDLTNADFTNAKIEGIILTGAITTGAIGLPI